ncbi:MAG: peptidogalycan biosysnthesis protein [Anaerolineales bacterium]|nr:peptidogalycan biosysnthesis protein [Anaerolineales bacterium]
MLVHNSHFTTRVLHRISDVDPNEWDRLSAGRPFTSHQWYQYGEAVMADCEPIYIILYRHSQPIARATFWRITNEPLPIQSTFLRQGIQFLFERWPLLICQSPLSYTSGLILPDTPLRDAVQTAISARASELLHQQGCSFLIFVYLPKKQFSGWPENLLGTTVSGPGTFMKMVWPNFEAYLDAGNKKDRQHYKRTMREAQKLGIQVSRHTHVERMEEALPLIRAVEHRFRSAPNPWARGMLEHFEMLDGATFLTATIGNRMVGCGLLLEDNGAQMNAALGLAEDVPYVYFTLVYESIKVAFDHHVGLMRLGTGAYEAKQQLGFSFEDNISTLFTASNPFFQKTAKWLGKLI